MDKRFARLAFTEEVTTSLLRVVVMRYLGEDLSVGGYKDYFRTVVGNVNTKAG